MEECIHDICWKFGSVRSFTHLSHLSQKFVVVNLWEDFVALVPMEQEPPMEQQDQDLVHPEQEPPMEQNLAPNDEQVGHD